MKNKNIWIASSIILLVLALFFGCGERSGEKEYNKAVASWKNGDLPRAQGQMEKAIKRLSDKEKKSVANNQLGLILWSLGKKNQSIEKFNESCRLTEGLTGANINRGIALYHTGQLNQARLEFTKILGEQPDNPMARTFAGLIHMQEKEWQEASRELAAVLKTNPSDPAAKNTLALAQLHMGSSNDKTIARLKQIAATYPDYAPAIYNLAVIYDQWLHDNTAARGWYEKYLKKAGHDAPQAAAAKEALARLNGTSRPTAPRPNYPNRTAQYVAAGSKFHAEKKYHEAISEYEKAIQTDPSQKTAYYNLGLSYYELKKYPEAIRACIEVLKLDSRDANARFMLALTYTQQGKWSDAEREAKALGQIDTARGESMLKYISDTRR